MNRSYKYRRGLKGGPNEINVQGSISVDGYKSGSKDVNNDFNIIKSNNITMKGVDFPVHGIDNLGYSQTMMPGLDYTFPGSEVFEVPLKGYQLGGDILKALKEKIRDEIAPVGYDNALNRIIDVLNPWNQDKKTGYEEHVDRYDKYSPIHGDENYDPSLFQGGMDVINERQDLFSILLGLDQKHNTIPVSKYKPTKTKNNDDIDYYSSPLTEKQITDHLAGIDIAKRFGNVDEFKKFLNNPTGYDKWKIGYGEVTGNFHIDHGEDERGPYISYYDIWDLDPFGIGDWTNENPILKTITDFGQNKILGVQPAELYNRLYYTLDDEGKIRFDDYPDAMSAYDRAQLEKEKEKEKQKGGEGEYKENKKKMEEAEIWDELEDHPDYKHPIPAGVFEYLRKQQEILEEKRYQEWLEKEIEEYGPEGEGWMAEFGGEGGRTTALRNFMYDKKRNKDFAQKGGATVPTEQIAQDDPRYNRDMDDDGVPVGIDIDDSREVPNQLMLLQAMKESSLDPKKISKKGAKGLTQVMPATLQDYIKNTGDKDVDLYDWKDSMKIQKWYMNNLYNRPWINKQNQNQNVRLAKTLAAYNWGPTKFNKFLNKVKDGVDIYDHKMEWLDHPDLPIETRDYIKTVLLRENEEFEGWIQEHNKNESKQAYIEAYGGIYKKGGSLLFPEWKRIRKHWKNYLSGKSINRDMYNKMVAYGFIKKKKYKRPDKRNRSFKNISSKNILKALNLGKMKKGGSLPEQVKIYEDYVRGVFDGTDLEEKAKRTADKIDRFYYYDLKGKDIHTLDHIKKLQKGGGDILSDIQNTARLNEEGYDAKLSDLRQYQRPGDMTKEEKLDVTETALSFFPFTGEAIDFKNTVKSASEGRYGDMVLNATGLAIPFLPGKVLVKGKNAIKGLFKKGSKEAAEKVVKEMPEWSRGKTSYNPENFLTDAKVREEYIKSGKWNEARKNALEGMKNQGKYLDEIGFDAKTLRGENMVFHGVDDGRSVVEVALPDGRTQLFYKSTDLSNKGVGDMWQPYGGHSYLEYTDPVTKKFKTTDEWFIKDGGYENFYDSKSYRDIATELDRHMVEQGWDMSDQIVMIDGKPTYPYRK